jgi:hypothetical protein
MNYLSWLCVSFFLGELKAHLSVSTKTHAQSDATSSSCFGWNQRKGVPLSRFNLGFPCLKGILRLTKAKHTQNFIIFNYSVKFQSTYDDWVSFPSLHWIHLYCALPTGNAPKESFWHRVSFTYNAFKGYASLMSLKICEYASSLWCEIGRVMNKGLFFVVN